MKDERLEVRLSPEQSATISAAAKVGGQSRSSFVVESAVYRAENVLRSQDRTVLSWKQAEEFLSWFDQPAEVLPDLKKLADVPSLHHR